jgi:putative DNA primase/helicase
MTARPTEDELFEQAVAPLRVVQPEPEAADPMPDEPLTELGYARRLISVYGGQIRYVPAWKRWLAWDGRRWENDDSGRAHRCAKLIARRLTTALVESDEESWKIAKARTMESARSIKAVLELTSTELEVVTAPDRLDADPFLLNTPAGTVDLRTRQLRPHNPADLLTKITGASLRRDAPAGVFSAFLERVQPDADMRAYIARVAGHALTGQVAEHVLPIFYGIGGNGKSTFIRAVLAALGDYAGPADPELLVARSFDAHPTGVADLFGKRVAVVDESDNGRRLAEATVKRLTGGDKLKARRMREDFWEFEPSHTFLMLTNHKPVITGTDEGIWRRIALVPWDVVIPRDEYDLELDDKLKGELDAVLAFMVRGFVDYRSSGLNPPETARQATAEYRDESDAVARFIEELCELDPDLKSRSEDLYRRWVCWCEAEGEEKGTNKAFSLELENRGFNKRRTSAGYVWRGLGMRGA